MENYAPYRQLLTVEERDCDVAGRMRAAALTYHLQEAAANHAEELNVGIPRLAKLGALWVVTRMSISVERLPEKGESIYAETWPGKTRHLLFPRYYEMKSEGGESLLRGSGVWMLIHPESRKMLFPEEIGLEVPDLSRGGELPLPDRRVRFPAELPLTAEHQTTVSELDVNQHVNNVYYLRWAEELLCDDFVRSHRLKNVWVEYRKEIRLGQRVELRHAVADGVLYVQGLVDGEEHYRLRFDYENI